MSTMISTKVTKGGQTTVPKDIRDALGITEGSRMFWSFDGTRAVLSAEPILPNEIVSDEEFWQGIEAAMRDVEEGRTQSAASLSAELRDRYGL
jgi:bifunctional DNA-binding transcriptional regulator/antitoxin component of YhaV-PrlF toxin-antitoxin module